MLNTNWLVDAGFNNDEMEAILGSFLIVAESVIEAAKTATDIPMSEQDVYHALDYALSISEKINAYMRLSTKGMFSEKSFFPKGDK